MGAGRRRRAGPSAGSAHHVGAGPAHRYLTVGRSCTYDGSMTASRVPTRPAIGETRLRVTWPVTVVGYLSDLVLITEEPGSFPGEGRRRGTVSVAEFTTWRLA